MKPYVEWITKEGYWVRDTWNDSKKRMSGIGKMHLFPSQLRVMSEATKMDEEGLLKYETILYSCPKKSGKALALDTPIPTPTGWTDMGSLKVGDMVFDDKGNPTRVSFISDVMTDHVCYNVSFSNGTSIVADAEHNWTVLVRNGSGIGRLKTLTTQELLDNGVERNDCYRYSIQIDSGLQLPEVELPIDPYLFGVWLGDGASSGARITCGYADLDETLELVKSHYPDARVLHYKDRAPTISLAGNKAKFLNALMALNVRGNKHIPTIYLRSSMSQRLELLKGLMDTDGYISEKGRCEFTSTNRQLAENVNELLRTLGIKSNILVGSATLNGKVVGNKYRIHFSPEVPVFKLARKAERTVTKNDTARSRFVRITSIEPTRSVPVKCIQVEAESHLYLAGTGMVPTHNTALAASVGAWYAECAQPGTEIYVIANTLEQGEGRLMRDIKFHFEQRILEGKYSDKASDDNHLKITQYRIDLPNGTFIQALAQSYKSVAGSRHALTLWDELWGTTSELDRRVWDEMTPIPTVQNSMRFISTYAGFENESELLWEMYLRGVGKDENENGRGTRIEGLTDLPIWENGKMLTYWSHEPTMPWQTEQYYEEQMQSERPSAFLRLHLNQWVTSQESFIPVEWVDSASKAYEASAEMWVDHPFKYWPVTIGLDAGIKQDCTALVMVGYDSKRAKVGLVYHKIWVPSKDKPIDLDEVEKLLVELYNKFTVSSIVYDPTHLLQMMNRLKNKGMPVFPFEQTEGNMTAASQLLFDLFKNRNIEMYPSEDLRRHLQMAVAETKSRGFRIVKNKVSKRHHIDGAVAMAMASYDAVKNGGVDVSIPVILKSPFSDMTVYGDGDDDEKFIPAELRS